jgi:hypothetical protein
MTICLHTLANLSLDRPRHTTGLAEVSLPVQDGVEGDASKRQLCLVNTVGKDLGDVAGGQSLLEDYERGRAKAAENMALES